MASSSYSSSHGHTSWTPPAQAVWALQDPALDHNGVFKRTQGNFDARLAALRASGLSVVSQVFDLFEKVEEYIKQNYPDGIDLLGFRMHASEKSLPLSREPGGAYSLADAGTAAASVQNIFSKVRRFVMIEGCQTGSGKNGILKHVVGLCPAGVIGIGSKGSEFEVGFDPTLPGYMSFQCLQSNKDITRIYYNAANGSVQNIPADELMLLWDLFKEKCATPEEKQRCFELCCQLLGERNDPVAFARIRSENQGLIDLVIGDFEAIRKELLEVNVSKAGAKAIWAEMLNALEALKDDLGGKNESTEIFVDKKEREKTADQVETLKGLLVASGTPYQKVYRFLLGCAFIDKYKPLLMLLDDEKTGYGPASQAIHALAALTVHGDDLLSITTILGHYFSIIKKSYLAGKDSYLLKQWFQGISKGICFNNQIKFIDEFYEERIRPSEQERLRSAILKDDGAELQSLIELGVDLSSPELEIDRLLLDAIDRKSYFIAFLLHAQLYPENHLKFIEELVLERNNKPSAIQIDAQLCLISKYLAGQKQVDRALEYAELIKEPKNKYVALCECARVAALLHDMDRAVEIMKTVECPNRCIPPLGIVIESIVAIALNLQEFTGAFELAQLIPRSDFQSTVHKEIVDAILEQKPLEEVIAVFKSSSHADSLFRRGVITLLAKGEDDQAVQLADAIQDPLEFDSASADIVNYLLREQKPDVAFEQAMKINDVFSRDEAYLKVFHAVLAQKPLEEVIALFKHSNDADFWFRTGVMTLLAKGEYDQAVQLADAIQDAEIFDLAHLSIVSQLRREQKLDAAFDQAIKIREASRRDACIKEIIEHLVKSDKGSVEQILDYSKSIEEPGSHSFIAFFRLEQHSPDQEAEFMNQLALECEHQSLSTEIEDQLYLISKYLADRGQVRRAWEYAELIRDPVNKYCTLNECARAAVRLHDIDNALEIIKTMVSPGRQVHPLGVVIEAIIEIALGYQGFTGALELAQLIEESDYRLSAHKRIFDAMLDQKPVEEVIALFQHSNDADSVFCKKVQQLLAKEEYDQAFQLADAIQDEVDFDRARAAIAKHLLREQKPDVAFDQAIKIRSVSFQREVREEIFDAMLDQRPLEAVIALFKHRNDADSVFCKKVKQLLAKGEYDQAVQLADAIQDDVDFDRARAAIVKSLLGEQKPDVAFDQAIKITRKKKRESRLVQIIEYLVKSDEGSIEQILAYSEAIQKPGSYSLTTFLRLESHSPDQEAEFMSKLSAIYQAPDAKYRSYDKQVKLISQYLLKKGDIARALDYAQLIKDPLIKFRLVQKCVAAANVIDDRSKAEQLKCKCVNIVKFNRSELKSGLKSLERDLRLAKNVYRKSQAKFQRVSDAFIRKFNRKNKFGFTLTVEVLCDNFNKFNCDKSKMDFLSKSMDPLMDEVICSYQSAKELNKKVWDLYSEREELRNLNKNMRKFKNKLF